MGLKLSVQVALFIIERGRYPLEPIKVLVVDDSAFMRKTISELIDLSPDFTVIGKARNGFDAIEKTKSLKPDLLTLDIEMPELDGLQALAIIMEETPIPVVMLSNGEHSTLEAFELGAVDFVMKGLLLNQPTETIIVDFWQRLKAAKTAKINRQLHDKMLKEQQIEKDVMFEQSKQRITTDKELIVIGCSTGGPSALQAILPKFAVDFPIPIIVVQHMPPGFTKPLAERFDSLCNLHVKEAENNEKIIPGTIYIAPAGLQTTIMNDGEQGLKIKLKIYTTIDTLYKPSIDVTLLSVSPILSSNLLTVILTGMGDDGLRGCKLVKDNNGIVLTEDESTCVVYGMPKVVYNAGLSDKTAPISNIYDELLHFLT